MFKPNILFNVLFAKKLKYTKTKKGKIFETLPINN